FLRRRARFTQWLQAAGEAETHREVTAALSRQDWARALFHLLVGRRLPTAVQLAGRVRDHRLATLIAQIGDAHGPLREAIATQLAEWAASDTLPLVDAGYRRVYELLAGHLGFAASTAPGAPYAFHTCEGLDWPRALAAYVWYGDQLDMVDVDDEMDEAAPTSLVYAINRFEQAVDNDVDPAGHHLVAAPHPWWWSATEGGGSGNDDRLTAQRHEGNNQWSTPYLLLKLYTDRNYYLERALAPSGYAPSPLDVRVSWALYQLLVRVYGLTNFVDGSVRDDGEAHPVVTSHAADRLGAAYAWQLETAGEWQWAAYVLLFLPDATARRDHILALLSRHLPSALTASAGEFTDSHATIAADDDSIGIDPDLEEFLTETLNIPRTWLHSTLAVHASYQGRHVRAAWHWVHAGEPNKAHRTVLTYLAPTWILGERYAPLRRLLNAMRSDAKTDRIDRYAAAVGKDEWLTGGHLYLEYMDVVEAVPRILGNLQPAVAGGFLGGSGQSEEPDAALYQIRQRMQALLKRLPHLPAPEPLTATSIPFMRSSPAVNMGTATTSSSAPLVVSSGSLTAASRSVPSTTTATTITTGGNHHHHVQGLWLKFRVSRSEMIMRLTAYMGRIDQYLKSGHLVTSLSLAPTDASFSLDSSQFNAPLPATTTKTPSVGHRSTLRGDRMDEGEGDGKADAGQRELGDESRTMVKVPLPDDARVNRHHRLGNDFYRRVLQRLEA
ncbi:hypothetical protein IWQ60_012246, partial [Tieghemiomyces parasiticus]